MVDRHLHPKACGLRGRATVLSGSREAAIFMLGNRSDVVGEFRNVLRVSCRPRADLESMLFLLLSKDLVEGYAFIDYRQLLEKERTGS